MGRVKRLQGYEEILKVGYIDIYAHKNHMRIVIEYGSGATIRWKSLEKLLQTNANICIVIVHWSYSDTYAYNRYIKRIKQVFSEKYDFYRMNNNQVGRVNLKGKEIWFSMINLKLFKLIIF